VIQVKVSGELLFGRELEMTHLAELIDGVRHRGGALIVRGEAGIGKSALLAEVSAFAQRLYLSHRTVSTQLHRTFPKLGISSRAE
jgi:predicted ATPase